MHELWPREGKNRNTKLRMKSSEREHGYEASGDVWKSVHDSSIEEIMGNLTVYMYYKATLATCVANVL